MSKEDMPEYLQEIERLKHKYKDQIEIYVALEIDYLDETYNASLPYFRELPLDYRIGSIHFLPASLPLLEKNMVCIDGAFENYRLSLDQVYHVSNTSEIGHVKLLNYDYTEGRLRLRFKLV